MLNTTSNTLKWLKLDKEDQSDIFYSCFGAIVASTLLALHLNVVPPTSPSPSSFWLKRLWRSNVIHQLQIQLRWALLVLVAPELLVSLSYGDWRAASEGARLFRNLGRSSIRNWRQTHANFANMGGLRVIVAYSEDELPHVTEWIARHQTGRIRGCLKEINVPFNRIMRYPSWEYWQRIFRSWVASLKIAPHRLRGPLGIRQTSLQRRMEEHTETIEMTEQGPSSSDRGLFLTPDHAEAGPSRSRFPDNKPGEEITVYIIWMILFVASELEKQQLRRSCATREGGNTISLYLNSRQIIAAQLLEIIEDIPDLSKAKIQDKGKANSLLKISAMVPLIWFTARIITKKYLQQKISKLELSSSTYIACCVTAYAFSWSKPQGVEQPYDNHVEMSNRVRPLTDEDLRLLSGLSGSDFISRNFLPPFGMNNERVELTQPIPTGTSLTSFAWVGGVALFDDDFAGTLCGLLIGCLYLLGWDSVSSLSILERVAWRSAVIAITSSLIPYSVANGICTVVFRGIVGPSRKIRTHIIHSLSLYSLLGIYVGGRLYMLGAMIQQFFAEEP